ncbi:MAG: ribbon-helix-helix domain-containing protein [Deltaproteobacteria bacterium]|nr:ribbon-helix-helix domain-containing protein [Deltaproteobacteria bacterium]
MTHVEKKKLVSIYLPPEIHERLRVASFQTRVPMSVLIEDIVRRHLDDLIGEIRSVRTPPTGPAR